MKGSAVLSKDGRYRYRLTRQISDKPGGQSVAFIMLNPSTANATEDDATIRRCVGFAKSWGFTKLEVANLFSYRATDPSELKTALLPNGPDATKHLKKIADTANRIIVAWGNSIPKDLLFRRHQVANLIFNGRVLHHLGLTKQGNPKHPLYLPADTKPIPVTSLRRYMWKVPELSEEKALELMQKEEQEKYG